MIRYQGVSLSGYERDALYLNTHGKFIDISGTSGIDSISDGRGPVYADFDNDGDTDVFLPTIQGASQLLFENRIGQRKKSIRVTLAGRASGSDAFGAVVRVRTSSGIQTRLKSGGDGFQSQHDPRLLFGLGDDVSAEWIEVRWPSGRVQRVEGASAGASIRIVEGEDAPQKVVERTFRFRPGLQETNANVRRIESRITKAQLARVGAKEPAKLPLSSGGTLVNFWASWCAACAMEMPQIARLEPRLAARKVNVVGLTLDDPASGAAERFAQKTGIRYPLFHVRENDLRAMFPDGLALPFTLLLDGNGRVRKVYSGFSASLERQILIDTAGGAP